MNKVVVIGIALVVIVAVTAAILLNQNPGMAYPTVHPAQVRVFPLLLVRPLQQVKI
jgi:hypothetical protein